MSLLDALANCQGHMSLSSPRRPLDRARGAAMGRERSIGYVENKIYGNDPELGIYERWPIYAYAYGVGWFCTL